MLLEFEHQKQNKGEYRDFYRVYYIEKTYGVGIYKAILKRPERATTISPSTAGRRP